MNKADQLILWLQQWYYQNCDGDWEHNQNVLITTIDNPGWSITIDLEGTNLEFTNYEQALVENDELDWYYSRIEEKKFLGACGPNNLLDLLQIFKNLVEKKSS